MQIETYNPTDADGIRSMLADHADYAPEQISKDAPEVDIAFFEDAFVHENDGLITYSLKGEGEVKGFMSMSRQLDFVKPSGWCKQNDYVCCPERPSSPMLTVSD